MSQTNTDKKTAASLETYNSTLPGLSWNHIENSRRTAHSFRMCRPLPVAVGADGTGGNSTTGGSSEGWLGAFFVAPAAPMFMSCRSLASSLKGTLPAKPIYGLRCLVIAVCLFNVKFS